MSLLPRPWRSKLVLLLLLLGVPTAGIVTGKIAHLGPWEVSQYSAASAYDTITTKYLDAMTPSDDGQVVRVVDGDTVKVRIAGKVETIRVLGIDTPETKKPGTPVQCFGPEATKNAEKWVAKVKRKVTLARDAAAPDRDRHQRLLRYVEPREGGRDLSEEQITGGFAKVAAYKQKLRHLPALERAQRAAKRDKRGLWGAC